MSELFPDSAAAQAPPVGMAMEVVVELSGTCVTYVHIFGGFDVSSSSSAAAAVEAEASNSLWGSAILFVRCDEMGVGGG